MHAVKLVLAVLLVVTLCQNVRSETINILLRSSQVPLVNIHIPGFEALTGHKVNLIPIALYNDLRDQLIADLRKGSPFYDAFIFNGQLKSELILCSDCDPEQRPLIAPLTELIRNDPALQWNDVAVFQRTTNSAYDGDIFTVPVDGDFHYMFYRKDVLDMFGFGVPQTWDDVLAIVKATNGQDLNGDGIPDFGLCAERKNRTDWNPTPYFFWSLAAPYIQSMGTSQGLFFDAETMDIMINTTGFREAAQMYRDLANHGPEENGTTLRSYWQKGRCAIAMDWADIATRSQQNVSIVANVTAMSLPPGTTRVYNRHTKQMEECTSTLCPNMDANGVSRAPFAATLGWTTAVSRFIPESRRQASYSFLSYVSQTNHSIQSVLIGTGWDVVRESQMNPALFLGLGWSNITAQSLALSARGAQNHLNAVVDMPLERWSEYYKIFGTLMSAFLHDEISLDDLQAQLTDAWNSLLDKYGRREQHVAYALSIGAHRPIFDEEVTLPDALRIAFLVISGFCILIALGLIVFVVINREKKVIRGTSPTFHYTTLGGATLIFLSVLLFSIPPPTSDLCVSSMWLFAIGFGFIYGSIFVKLYRLWRLSAKSLTIKRISDAHLLPFLGGILAVYLTLLVAWTVVDPPAAAQYRQGLEPDQYMVVCQTGSTGQILFILILAWSCVMLLVGIVLSFLTRNLAEAYNESRPVSMSVYIYSFSAVILIPILFVVPNALVVFIATCAVLVFSTLVTLVALFLSKIVKIKKGLGDKVSTGRSGSTAAHSSPNSSALQYTTSVQTETTKRRELELENQMLRERLSDLERQLLEKPKPIASSSSSSSD